MAKLSKKPDRKARFLFLGWTGRAPVLSMHRTRRGMYRMGRAASFCARFGDALVPIYEPPGEKLAQRVMRIPAS